MRSDTPRYEVAPLKWRVVIPGEVWDAQTVGEHSLSIEFHTGRGFLVSGDNCGFEWTFETLDQAKEQAFEIHSQSVNKWLMPVYGGE